MSHRNARLTVHDRRLLIERIRSGRPVAHVAKEMGVSRATVERFNRTLLNEWAYLRPYATNDERTAALADFLHTYNHHRCHTALGGHPPMSRVNNAAGQFSWSVSL